MDAVILEIGQLEKNISLFELSKLKNINLISKINSQISYINTLMEAYSLPSEFIDKYNNLRLKYTKKFSDQRAHYSVDRNIRINKIYQDVENIVDTQELIKEYVNSQNDSIDIISANMAATDIYTVGSVREIDIHRKRVAWKMRFWRWIAMIIFAFGIIFTYALILR